MEQRVSFCKFRIMQASVSGRYPWCEVLGVMSRLAAVFLCENKASGNVAYG